MLRVRVIPCLLLRGESLVKTVRFGRFDYIGDPLNTCRIFNELEVDEMALLDITASRERRGPNLQLLQSISNECFMPLAYGGGIRDVATAERVFAIGFEKVIINMAALDRPELITELAGAFGSQSVIVSMDVRRGPFWGYRVWGLSGTVDQRRDPVAWAKEVESRGAGEILLTSIDREGTWSGFDHRLTRQVSDAVSIPVIAHGGGGSVGHIGEVVHLGHASAVALGSMVVYQRQSLGVLVNFPLAAQLEEALLAAGDAGKSEAGGAT